MNTAYEVKEYVNAHKEREPIIVKDLKVINKNARDVAFHRLEESGLIKAYKKGIYYKPKKTPFGELGIDKNKLIVELYVEKKNEIIGYTTGPVLWNMWGVSTQLPKQKWITTNVISRNTYIDDMNLKLIKPKLKVTRDNYKLLQILDYVDQMNDIQDINWEKYTYVLKQRFMELDSKQILQIVFIMKYYNKFVNNFTASVIEELWGNIDRRNFDSLIKNKLLEQKKNACSGHKYKINNRIKFDNLEEWGFIK